MTGSFSSVVVLLDPLFQLLGDVPRRRIPRKVKRPTIRVSVEEDIHHADHLGRIFSVTVKMRYLIAAQFQGRRHDQASFGLLPLRDNPVGAGWVEHQALLHFHGERTELIDREEGLVWAKFDKIAWTAASFSR